MLLLIDIGNTNITVGSYENGINDVRRHNINLLGRDGDKYPSIVEDLLTHNLMAEPEGAAVCSVVPQVTPAFIKTLKGFFGRNVVNVSHKVKTGLKFRIKNPGSLGADRICNLVAAGNLYKGPSIVIDFGTATTFSVVSADREYKGGVIMPGLGISAGALAEKTAKLPKIKLRAPGKVLGRDTISSMLSGIIFGHAGAVKDIIRGIRKEMSMDGSMENSIINVIATGGDAGLVVPYIGGVKEVNPFLTLEGLRMIYELNV